MRYFFYKTNHFRAVDLSFCIHMSCQHAYRLSLSRWYKPLLVETHKPLRCVLWSSAFLIACHSIGFRTIVVCCLLRLNFVSGHSFDPMLIFRLFSEKFLLCQLELNISCFILNFLSDKNKGLVKRSPRPVFDRAFLDKLCREVSLVSRMVHLLLFVFRSAELETLRNGRVGMKLIEWPKTWDNHINMFLPMFVVKNLDLLRHDTKVVVFRLLIQLQRLFCAVNTAEDFYETWLSVDSTLRLRVLRPTCCTKLRPTRYFLKPACLCSRFTFLQKSLKSLKLQNLLNVNVLIYLNKSWV